MRSPPPTLLWSIALHCGGIGTACALGWRTQAAEHPVLHIAVQPVEASVPIAAAAPPVERVDVERDLSEVVPEVAEPTANESLEELVEPTDPDDIRPTDLGPLRRAAASPSAWLTKAVGKTEPPPPPPPPQSAPLPASQPAPAQVSEQARVIEVIVGEDPKPKYPMIARQRGWQGDTEIRVEVGEDGRVLAAEVSVSSGHGALDRAAVRAVQRWRFRGGAGQTSVTVHFRLTDVNSPKAADPPPAADKL